MIGYSKNIREINWRKCFWWTEKETRVEIKPWVSANQPLKNWAQREYRNYNKVSHNDVKLLWNSYIVGFKIAKITRESRKKPILVHVVIRKKRDNNNGHLNMATDNFAPKIQPVHQNLNITNVKSMLWFFNYPLTICPWVNGDESKCTNRWWTSY